MKLKDLMTESLFSYQTGDSVITPFGVGVIVTDLGADRVDHYFEVVFDADVRAEHSLEDKPVRIGSFQLKGKPKVQSA